MTPGKHSTVRLHALLGRIGGSRRHHGRWETNYLEAIRYSMVGDATAAGKGAATYSAWVAALKLQSMRYSSNPNSNPNANPIYFEL